MPDSTMNNPSILVVEDEAIVAADIALKLERLGYSVPETAASADEAMELAERLKPALVLMDIHLHGSTDGIEAARAIQARQDVPVIFLSGSSDSDTLKRVISSGPTGFILKPFEERDMVAQVELALYKHRADQILREKEQRYRTLFQENRAVLLLIDPLTGSIANANPAACRYYGYTLEEITALNISDINTLPSDRIAEKIESITSEQGGHFYFQHRLADGRIRDVEVFSGMVVDSGRDRIYSIVHDITDHKRAQESLRQLNDSLERQVDERTQLAESRAAQLQTLAVELLQAEEHERQRLADMLHNDQQQIIAAARMKVQGLMEKLPGMSEMSEVVHMLTQSIDSLRALSFELNPIGLQKGRLIEGLEWLGKDMRKRFGLRVTLQADSDDMILNVALKRFIFRAVQELLFNVVKHAETREARVEVVEQENNISIAVSDQGKGFDTAILENSAKPDGLGLLSLRERIRHIDGSFAIDSVPGEGCRIDLKIPLMMLKKADFECLHQKATQMIRHVSETPHGNDSGLLKVLHELEVQHGLFPA